MVHNDGRADTDDVRSAQHGDLTLEGAVFQGIPAVRRGLDCIGVIDENEVVEGHADTGDALEAGVRIEVGNVLGNAFIDLVEQAFIRAGLGDGDVHQRDIGLRSSFLGAQRAEHGGGTLLREIVDLYIRVGGHERLDDGLGVTLLEKATIAEERHGLLGVRRHGGRAQHENPTQKYRFLHCPVLLYCYWEWRTDPPPERLCQALSFAWTNLLAPEISGSFSPLRRRSRSTISASCMPMARSAMARAWLG